MILSVITAALVTTCGIWLFNRPGPYSYVGAGMYLVGAWTLAAVVLSVWLSGTLAVLLGAFIALAAPIVYVSFHESEI